MDDPKKTLHKQGSTSHIEQSLKIIPLPPQQAPVMIYPGPKSNLANLSKADLEIADRLKKLRKKEEELPTEEEMASRLAQLKGLPPDHYSKSQSISFAPPDKRTDFEKSNDLLKQMMEETTLDARRPKPEDEIETRLARLRDAQTGSSSSPSTPLAPPHARPSDSLLPSPEAPLDYDEVEQLLKAAELESNAAIASLKDLSADPTISAVLADANRKKARPRPGAGSATSSDEKMSASDDDEKMMKDPQKATLDDAAEVERIVQLYTKKAQKKKRRKLRVKRPEGAPDSTSSSGRSSDHSESDLTESTSESEKLSDSD